MFKTGVITASWVGEINNHQPAPWPELVQMHWDRFGLPELDALFERIAGLGFEYVEYWIGHSGNLGRTPLWRGVTPEQVLSIFDKHGLKLASFCPGGLGRDTEMEPIFEFAHSLGAKMLTGWLGPQKEVWERVVSLCERYDMRYGIEPHGPEYSLTFPEDLLKACAFSERLGVCPDTGVWAHQGVDVILAVEKVAEHTIHMHLKGYHQDKGFGCAPGEDDIGLDRVVRFLRDAGYTGVYSLEYEADHDPDPELKRARAWLLDVLEN